MRQIVLPILCGVFIFLSTETFADELDHRSVSSSTRKTVKARQENNVYRQSLALPETVEKSYADFKKWLEQKTGLSYALDISFLGQRGAPNGKQTPWQSQYYGTANWDMFHSDALGNGSMQFAYTAVRYWGANANTIANRIGVMSSFNDDMSKANYFDQLTYTHQFPDKLSWLSMALGQFPISNFDGTAYDSNQQINFLNEALSQNASSTYPSASLGAFVSISPNKVLNFSAGFQDAHNISGSRIMTSRFGKKKYTSFISATYSPEVKDFGSGTYSIMVYNQPSVPEQPGTSNGWSFNFSQNMTSKWAVFGRINGAARSPETIKQSYVLGTVWNNPFNRNNLDQIGFAGAVNKLNKAVNPAGSRSVENVLEAYFSFGISNFMILTPDIQFYIHPGADQNANTATVASLRATLMF